MAVPFQPFSDTPPPRSPVNNARSKHLPRSPSIRAWAEREIDAAKHPKGGEVRTEMQVLLTTTPIPGGV